jgi:hypothetical protein
VNDCVGRAYVTEPAAKALVPEKHRYPRCVVLLPMNAVWVSNAEKKNGKFADIQSIFSNIGFW